MGRFWVFRVEKGYEFLGERGMGDVSPDVEKWGMGSPDVEKGGMGDVSPDVEKWGMGSSDVFLWGWVWTRAIRRRRG